MHAATLATGEELSEYRRHPSVSRHVPDVVLAGIIVGGVDDEQLARRIVRRRGADRLDVGSVPRLGHGKAAWQLHRHRGPQVALVVSLGPQPADHSTEEPVLHADLDQQGEINKCDRLERRERAAHVAFAAVLTWKKQSSALRPADQAGLLHHPGAVILDR